VVDENKTANFFKAIAHPTRISILKTIYNSNFCVNDLSDQLHLNQPNTSQHLAILKSKNIIKKTKNGNEVCYQIKNPSIMKIIENAERLIEYLDRD
jgi:DNA-binding transcriptional ArsR family regulator